MKSRPEHLLDKCLQQLDDGGDVEEVLATYPELADELRPALAASEWMRAFAPPPRRRLEQKQRFVAAVAERRRLVERVDGLVVEIKAGVPATELSARLDASLRPVVAAAHRMHATELPLPAPEAVESGRLRLMAMAAERRRANQPARAASSGLKVPTVGMRRGLLQGLLPRPSLARRVLSSAAAATLAATLALAGVVRVQSVAASSLPGEAFYGVKRLGENARMLFAFDPSRRADLEALFAQRRAQELLRLEAEGREVPIDFVETWLTGHSASAAALADLTRDQRDALSRALRAVADDGDARARLEGSGVAADVLDALLAPEPPAEPVPAVEEPIGLHRGPSPRPQPLPEDDAAPAPAPAKDPAPPVAAEPVAPPANPAPVGFVEAIPVAQPDDDAGDQGGVPGSNGSTGTGSSNPNPGTEPPSDPPAGIVEPPPPAAAPTDEPPPFVDPIAPGPQEPPDDPSGGTAP